MIIAAKYLGVAPWDLAAAHPKWMDWAHMAMEALIKAEKDIEERKGHL